jgi:ABC-2 type transport system ATP-binding protein
VIEVRELSKYYTVHRRSPGLWAALRSVAHRPRDTVKAVDRISFSIAAGETVGFLGPNGAGKTTTLKVLAGLLHATAGEARVAGHIPYQRRPEFLKQITLVMGQKQQLIWDLPPADTFEMNRAIYEIPGPRYRETLAELDALLDLGKISRVPTRQLSLGERMKCELAAALLHRPQVLFLDEPTIGLDVSMQAVLRGFVRTYNQRFGATVVLTSHYMEDVVALCPRVIVIDRGHLRYDGQLTDLSHSLRPEKLIRLRFSRAVPPEALARFGQVLAQQEDGALFKIQHPQLRDAVAHMLAELPVSDLTVEDPPIEDVMRDLFANHEKAPG